MLFLLFITIFLNEICLFIFLVNDIYLNVKFYLMDLSYTLYDIKSIVFILFDVCLLVK